MSMHGGPMGRFGSDVDSLRAKNAAAPKIPHLGRRIAGLFAPHKGQLGLTIGLILISACLSIIPPLLIQDAFNKGLFPEMANQT